MRLFSYQVLNSNLYIALACLSLFPEKPLTCPTKGSRFGEPVDPETINSISSWTACAAECYKKGACVYWNWEDENGGSPNTCTLMANYVEDILDENFIGGNSECNKISKLISS